MRSFALAAALLVVAVPVAAADLLAEARRLYNLGQYEAAEPLARDAIELPGLSDAARVVLGRIQLERYRRSADMADLRAARESLRLVDPGALDPRERIELLIGVAEALYLEDRYGAAADLFESVLDNSAILGPSAHERVLDWWATAMDRQAQTRPLQERTSAYDRILDRMRLELRDYPGSTAVNYWRAAAARAAGDLDGALQAAMAGWLRGVLAEDRGAALRADLDRLVVQAILPDRAARLSIRGDTKQVVAVMLSEWESFKNTWSR